MRSLGTRRVALAAGTATVAVLALAGCSAGQVAETALLQAPISGLNTQSPDGRVQIRNLQVDYTDPEGYPANGDASIEVGLYNHTTEPVTILISSKPLQNETAGVVSARQIGLSGGSAAASPSANPEPSGGPDGASAQPGPPDQAGSIPDPSGAPSASGAPASAPAAATLQPARITLQALSSTTFLPDDTAKLVAAGLSDDLKPGNSLSLVFEISGYSQPLELLAPVAIPLSPASRGPAAEVEEHE
ncbi:hypothetical protein M1L60_28000 [Actinoplanes sp. TRM 88003]|uniref:Lipoprotein n=1 Tax=Paractinoplanes aksuensis TaxID=2939490 RepID=A0ABT1DWL5_9ACTN|nr:hypothetical protein [Actinoplanes aksuensis]MCO8274446.1 hypothetical protein [Actinoplanes aksuensis]